VEGLALSDEAPGAELRARFEEAMLPHLDAAYNLARWLTANDADAEDVVQEAYLRALRFFAGFRGGDGRAWLLAVVRHTCYTWLERHRGHRPSATLDDDLVDRNAADPAKALEISESRREVREALADLPVEFREMLVLRELEGLSYKEIAVVTELPTGTVMSRLARARERLLRRLVEGPTRGLPRSS
jgi:RNA polymerase sigma-70 factor (ECF subfamily)